MVLITNPEKIFLQCRFSTLITVETHHHQSVKRVHNPTAFVTSCWRN